MAKKTKKPSSLIKPQDPQSVSLIDGTKAYAQLRETVMQQGILNRSYRYYAMLVTCIYAGFIFSLYNIVVQKSLAPLIFWCFAFSFFSVQIAGLFHDAGHYAIFKSKKLNGLIGHLFGATIAAGFSSWKIKHNLHHAYPNQEGADPDVDLPLLSFTRERFTAKKGVAKLLRRYQKYIYYPLGILVVFTVRDTAIRYFRKNFKPKMTWEVVIFILGLFAWFVLPFLLFPLSKAFIVLAIVNATVGVYLFNVFAPNHKGMPMLAHNVKLSFLEHQVITTRNIYGHWLTDFVYMGLNYQIEHHLFPNCPRNKLRLITPYLLEICKKLHLEYTQVDVITSSKMILDELDAIATFPDETKKYHR